MGEESFCCHNYLEGVSFLPVHDFKEECSYHVEALAVADGLVPAGVRQEDPLEQSPLFLVVFPTEPATTRTV